ncbi:hypothetical protein [Streptomyces sp. NPDC048309]|uniref:hypothetical protein n=1 Tax=Streptomyces sp. NPDC048309 TaxID=3154618 RepID=UPI0033E8CE13
MTAAPYVTVGGANGLSGGLAVSDGGLWTPRGASAGITPANALTFGPASVGVSTSGYPRFGQVMLR